MSFIEGTSSFLPSSPERNVTESSDITQHGLCCFVRREEGEERGRRGRREGEEREKRGGGRREGGDGREGRRARRGGG